MPAKPPPPDDEPMPETEPIPTFVDPPPVPVAAGWPHWRYLGSIERIYTNIPATVRFGDIVTWPNMPNTDGCWEQTTDPVTKHPDSHRPEPATPVQEG